MSYLVINNTKSYHVTDNYNKPYIHVSNSILPLTTNGDGLIHCKDNNGNTYRPMEYGNVQTTYYTSAEVSDGLSSTTALTRESTSGTSYLTTYSDVKNHLYMSIYNVEHRSEGLGTHKWTNCDANDIEYVRLGTSSKAISTRSNSDSGSFNEVRTTLQIYISTFSKSTYTWSGTSSNVTGYNKIQITVSNSDPKRTYFGTTYTTINYRTYTTSSYINETLYSTNTFSGFYASITDRNTFSLDPYFALDIRTTSFRSDTETNFTNTKTVKNHIYTFSSSYWGNADMKRSYSTILSFGEAGEVVTTGTSYLTCESTSGYSGVSSTYSSIWQ